MPQRPPPEILADPGRFAAWWAQRRLTTGPLSDGERTAVAAAIRRCYRAAGLYRPVRIVWCADPQDAAGLLGPDAELRFARFAAAAPRYRRWPPWLRRAADTVRSAAATACSSAANAWLAVVAVWAGLFVLHLVPPIGRVLDRLRTWTDATVPAGWVGLIGLVLLGGLVHGAVRGARRAPERAAARRASQMAAVDASLALPVDRAFRWFRGGPGVDGERTLPAPDGPAPPARLWSLQGWMARPAFLGAVAAAAREELLTDRPSWLPQHRRWRRVVAAHAAAAPASWHAFHRLAVVGDPPREVRDLPGHAGCRAVVWSGGEEWFLQDGVRLPRRPDAGPWTVAEIGSMANTEMRRVMIESIGWPTYIRQAGLRLVATAPDPGNRPHELRLYEPPDDERWRGRLLLMTNGSPDRGGGLRHFAEYVPHDLDDPVAAAAWQYGVPVRVYRALRRRT